MKDKGLQKPAALEAYEKMIVGITERAKKEIMEKQFGSNVVRALTPEDFNNPNIKINAKIVSLKNKKKLTGRGISILGDVIGRK